jgi:hypothetical protein
VVPSDGTANAPATAPRPHETEVDKLTREFNSMHDEMERTLNRLRNDIAKFKVMLTIKESQNSERIRVLQVSAPPN